MILKGYAPLKATLILRSGLHIGTGEKNIEKGESLPVLVSPRTQLPYIPGSSLKGKMRNLLELAFGRQATVKPGSPCSCGRCQICHLFGSASVSTTYEPSRLIFRDSFPNEATVKLLEKIDLEDKPGVSIDRETGKAAGGALFPMKRVPEGCEFTLEVSARVFANDDRQAIKKWLAMGLYLMEQDAIGGGGTRGSGHVEFKDVTFDGADYKSWREDSGKERDNLQNQKIK
jgi:CRISPR-associated protein Csm3